MIFEVPSPETFGEVNVFWMVKGMRNLNKPRCQWRWDVVNGRFDDFRIFRVAFDTKSRVFHWVSCGVFEAEVFLIFHKTFGCQGRFAAGSSTIGALEKAKCI